MFTEIPKVNLEIAAILIADVMGLGFVWLHLGRIMYQKFLIYNDV